MNLFKVLTEVESKLPVWLEKPENWDSMLVDYHKPFVRRLWRSHSSSQGDVRVFLHEILPCNPGEALYHPHPWPSIVRVMPWSGKYEHKLGWFIDFNNIATVSEQIIDGTIIYSMTDPLAWHSVRPIDGSSWSIMVSGKPYDSNPPGYQRPEIEQGPLSDLEKRNLFSFWKSKLMEL